MTEEEAEAGIAWWAGLRGDRRIILAQGYAGLDYDEELLVRRGRA